MWFTFADLKQLYPQYKKVEDASEQWVNNTVIPKAQDYVSKFVSPPEPWTDGSVPGDILRVAQNYAVNKILADDETVRIAQARGQPEFTVSGDTVPLDLSLGRNPLLSVEDEAILLDWADRYHKNLHLDKVTVRSQGKRYDNSQGGDTNPPSVDYVDDDGLPGYFKPA
jgi:hypothetical protein